MQYYCVLRKRIVVLVIIYSTVGVYMSEVLKRENVDDEMLLPLLHKLEETLLVCACLNTSILLYS